MKYNGLLVDEAAMIRKQGECAAKIIDLRDKIREIIGDVDIGANAGTQAFKDYLFKTKGLPVLKVTEKNAEAADDQTMVMLAEWCADARPELVPLFDLIQEYRKWSKLKTTYLDGYLRFINSATGRIHPDMLPLATETGRFAARNPNLQNMPRKTNDPVGIRSFIVAPEGHVLVSCDFSQIELRIGAFYCRDAKMLETYRSGGDIHAATTSVIFGIPYEQAVVFHKAAVYRRGAFDFLDDLPVLRQLGHEPAIEPMVQPQGIVRVGAGIAHGFGIVRRQFIEIPARRHFLEGRQFVPQQLRYQVLQAAIRQAPKDERLFEGHLGRRDSVIAGRLDDNAQGIKEHGLEGEVMCHLDNAGIRPHQFCQQRVYRAWIGVAALQMLQGA